MKNLNRIINAVYNEKWLITPAMHRSIQKQLDMVLNGNASLPLDDAAEDDSGVQQVVSARTALISIDGVIGKHLSMLETQCGGVDLDNVRTALQAVASDPDVSNIVLYFNTPGGTSTGTGELASYINQIAQTKNVVGYTDTLCASAGYYLASQCTAFYCSPSSDVGSVGVYSVYLDETAALNQEGIKVNAVSAGKYKLMGASFRTMSDEERAMIQSDVDNIYTSFKSAVTSNRSIADADLQGQVFSGDVAVTKGFADGNIDTLQELLTGLEDNTIN